ncbi:MAG: histidinol-phosphate transaminase, partial [Candidatus Omnitrophota bacterium]
MRKLVKQNILNVRNYVPGKPIEEVRRELGLKEVIKLASNENCLGPSPKALSAIKKSLSDIHRYPDGASFYLKNRLSKFLGVKGANIIIGNGSDEVITLAIKAFVHEGDEVVIARPTFLIYEIASQVQGANIKFVPLKKDMRYDLPAMKAAVTDKTKIVFIANPDNPTGTYVSKSELDAFLKGLRKDVIIFLDEAYFEFAYGRYKDYPNGMDYLSRPGIIVSRSFSKAYGLAGLRIGYGVASEEVISCMDKVREPFNVNLLAQAAATAALDDNAFLLRSVAHVKKESEFLYSNLKKMGLRYMK